MTCMQFRTCPLFNYFSAHPILSLWRINYCDKPDNSHCVRFQNTAEGKSNPLAMLPNGNMVETAPLALLNAIRIDRFHLVKNILTNIDIDVDFQDINGNTALMIAAGQGFSDIAYLLLERGANKDIKNYNNETAYDLSLIKKQKDTAALLLDYK